MHGQDQNVISLFGGEHIQAGCRGRTSRPIKSQPGRWVIATLLAVLFGFSTAATAITVKHKAVAAQMESLYYSLPANYGARQWGYGFEEALY